MGKRKTQSQRAIECAERYGINPNWSVQQALRSGIVIGWKQGRKAATGDMRRANRISAAERRVVEAAACYFNSENASARVVNACNLKNQVEALQRAKGGANG